MSIEAVTVRGEECLEGVVGLLDPVDEHLGGRKVDGSPQVGAPGAHPVPVSQSLVGDGLDPRGQSTPLGDPVAGAPILDAGDGGGHLSDVPAPVVEVAQQGACLELEGGVLEVQVRHHERLMVRSDRMGGCGAP